jgi:hypothetical protein
MTSPRLVWSEGAEVAKRRQHPHLYWCVRDDTGVQYFWGAETPVSRKNTLRTRARKIAYEGPQLLRLPHRHLG